MGVLSYLCKCKCLYFFNI